MDASDQYQTDLPVFNVPRHGAERQSGRSPAGDSDAQLARGPARVQKRGAKTRRDRAQRQHALQSRTRNPQTGHDAAEAAGTEGAGGACVQSG